MSSGTLSLLPILAAQLWFIAAVAMLLYVMYLRKRLRYSRQEMDEAQETIEKLQQQLQLQLQPAPSEVTTDNTQGQETLILSYQQRIKNLEKFRKLFFELEEKLSSELEQNKSQDDYIQELIKITSDQERVIAALKQSIDEISRKYSLEHDAREKLQDHMEVLYDNSDALKQKLQGVEKELVKINLLESELEHYRQRIDELEDSERALRLKADELRREAEMLEEMKRNPHPFGEVKIREIETLSENLKKKEDEIRHLRSECETVARQYEELASKSMHDIERLQKTSEEEQINLNQMQTILERSATALAEKDREIATLEALCMQLKGNGSDGAQQLLDKSIRERSDLQVTIFDIGEQVGSIDDEHKEKLQQLRSSLESQHADLRQKRGDYQEARQQGEERFGDSDLLQQELEHLRRENRALKQAANINKRQQQELQEKNQEIEQLRQEVVNLEERCLRILSKETP